ncbi:MAG: 50S ribosomal protein L24 [Candidatus Zambryskibacteria bacterium CG_4_9_14_3_um_filter_42_9]|uniref:Large ribosomal subunit protein uL24 n=1 Tax=Candidatus Zambryskibacteria bacterium CG22_combo_CG10-13_8_21_14_all_42_17 TaxID=1975118 RepID=A0A2H0BDJ0_9BACT|nr:MAG: 50S ribosomal protein L24 [Candidatus Zambryskibacteria bacterium CG22_combo_CG10-13_8_21_14_all_42_17]PJA36741.1 MAG: 50S ribosomal protein L24 [Candidatus Zambryskibacteria bacterium CG_4_9_14_3_um_filter_42_9]
MHVKKGDTIIVLAGKDKGKTGLILKAFPKEDKVLVEGVNVKKVHQRAQKKETKGTIIEKNFPIHVSNVKKTNDKKTTGGNKSKSAGHKS